MDSNFNAFTAIAEKTGETIMARGKKVRYAVVGLGHIAQGSVLPAFHQARQNSTLATIVSSDATKRKELSEHYDLERTWDYDQYDDLLASGDIDAVFIALPNDMHRDFTVRALQAGIHVLCEKPMAITSDDCRQMIAASGDAKLMIAYRLHFEEATLQAIERVKSGEIGEPRFFHSEFSMTVKPDDIRLQRKHGGGTLYDIGVYCINAARHLFQAEPIEAMALAVADTRPRFEEVDEMTSAILRFPGDRLASFTCSFGAADYSSYRVIGTEGVLRVEPGMITPRKSRTICSATARKAAERSRPAISSPVRSRISRSASSETATRSRPARRDSPTFKSSKRYCNRRARARRCRFPLSPRRSAPTSIRSNANRRPVQENW
jgi:predicted dehydrogenase